MSGTFGPYPARVNAVHDGDTVYLTLDLGFGHMLTSHDFDGRVWLACRVYGINAPELADPTGSGRAARDYAKTLLKPGDLCQVTSHGWDKFGGRFDGTITLADGRDFAGAMLTAGHAAVLKL